MFQIHTKARRACRGQAASWRKKSGPDALVTAVVNLGIVITGMIAYVFDLLVRWLEQALLPWKGKMEPTAEESRR